MSATVSDLLLRQYRSTRYGCRRFRSDRDDVHRGHQHWLERLGADHPDTQTAAAYLAWALRDMGLSAEARDLDQQTFAYRRQILGEDHPRLCPLLGASPPTYAH